MTAHLSSPKTPNSSQRNSRKNRNSPRRFFFGFNGKECDNSTAADSYDFGARILDARIGRWLGVDALHSKYSFLSPYAFAANSPIVLLDNDGRDNIIYLVVLPGSEKDLLQNKFTAQEVANLANENFCLLGVNTKVVVCKPEDFVFCEMDKTDGVAIMGSGTEEVFSFMRTIDPVACEELFEAGQCSESKWTGMDLWDKEKTGNPERGENWRSCNKPDGSLHSGGEVIAIDTNHAIATANNISGNSSTPNSIAFAFAVLINHSVGHLAGLGHCQDEGAYVHNTADNIMAEDPTINFEKRNDQLGERKNPNYRSALLKRFGDNVANEHNSNVENMPCKE